MSYTLVGVAGFEPTTSASRTPRATKLRYTPKLAVLISVLLLHARAEQLAASERKSAETDTRLTQIIHLQLLAFEHIRLQLVQ